MQSSGIRVKIKLSDKDGSTEAAGAGVANGRSHRNGPEVMTLSDDDDVVIMQVLAQLHASPPSVCPCMCSIHAECFREMVMCLLHSNAGSLLAHMALRSSLLNFLTGCHMQSHKDRQFCRECFEPHQLC